MNSKKTLIGAGLALIAVAFAAGYAFRGDSEDVDNSPSPTPSATVTASPTAIPATPKPTAHTVSLTSADPLPKSLTVRAGDQVSFTNDNGLPYWLASDQCPGFNSHRDLQHGDTYTLIFTERRTCDYHNQSNPTNTAQKGTIVVQ